MTEQSAAVVNLPAPVKREPLAVIDPIPVLDTARFEHMQRIANVMARSNLLPESLTTIGPKDRKENLPWEQVLANCFLIVNQAVRWNFDPFAVAQCVSVVHGKLCYEGKLVAAVIEAKLGIRLRYEWSGEGEATRVIVSGRFEDEDEDRTVEGTVSDWKTTGAGSPWTPKQYRKMLAYRGAREWARLHAPAIMLGVYSDDELTDLAEGARAARAMNVTRGRLSDRLSGIRDQQEGFDPEHVTRETAGDEGGPSQEPKGGDPDEVAASAPDGDGNSPPEGPDANSELKTPDIDSGSGGSEAVEAGGAGNEPTSAGSPASTNIFAAFASALYEVEATGNAKTDGPALKKVVKEFWLRHEYPEDENAKSKLDKIHAAHVKRLKGELDAKGLAEELRELVL